MMKKMLAGLMILGLFGSVAFGNNLFSLSASPVSSDFLIKSTTLGTANTIGTLILPGAGKTTTTLNLRARGGDIRWCKTNSITEPFFTIGENETWSDHFPVPLPANTVLYFWATSAPVTIEAWYTYR